MTRRCEAQEAVEDVGTWPDGTRERALVERLSTMNCRPKEYPVSEDELIESWKFFISFFLITCILKIKPIGPMGPKKKGRKNSRHCFFVFCFFFF